MTPAFSVVIPCRDRANLLHRALASLERQSFRDFETIVVDDGSRENLAAAAGDFPGLRVRLLAGRGRGANPARNLGTDAARAAYVAYLDSDDVFLPGKLASAARRIVTDPADLLVSGGYVWRSGGSVQVKPGRRMAPGEDISEFYFAAGERFLTSSWVVRTAVARRVRWDEGLRKVQDPDFIIRLVRAGFSVGQDPEPQVVLFDDVQSGRISDSIVPDALRDWLSRSGDILTPRARAGFEVYALAYEEARLNRLRGFRQLAASAASGRAPWRLTAKSAYRLLVPVGMFKATARLAARGARSGGGDLAEYLRSLETAPRSAG